MIDNENSTNKKMEKYTLCIKKYDGYDEFEVKTFLLETNSDLNFLLNKSVTNDYVLEFTGTISLNEDKKELIEIINSAFANNKNELAKYYLDIGMTFHEQNLKLGTSSGLCKIKI
jgi:hypothetical protein